MHVYLPFYFFQNMFYNFATTHNGLQSNKNHSVDELYPNIIATYIEIPLIRQGWLTQMG